MWSHFQILLAEIAFLLCCLRCRGVKAHERDTKHTIYIYLFYFIYLFIYVLLTAHEGNTCRDAPGLGELMHACLRHACALRCTTVHIGTSQQEN